MHKYLAKYAAHLITTDQSVNALQLYLQHGSPALPQNYNIYTKITLECFSKREKEIAATWKDLRLFLFQVVQAIKDAHPADAMLEHFEQLLLIAHYYGTRSVCREVPSLNFIAVRISIALLRYTDTIPVDKGFFEAGMDLRSVGRESEAFIFINHYLDVCEAIEENSGMLVDHSDLTVTDFPSSVPIPESMHLTNDPQLHEEIREWILAVSMDQKIDQVRSFIACGFIDVRIIRRFFFRCYRQTTEICTNPAWAYPINHVWCAAILCWAVLQYHFPAPNG